MGDNFTRSYTCAREVGIACQGSVEQPLEKPSLSESPLDPHQEEEEEKEEEEEEDKEEKEEKEEEEDSLDCQLWDDHSAHFFRF